LIPSAHDDEPTSAERYSAAVADDEQGPPLFLEVDELLLLAAF
jgi:hypothetical protein